MARYALDVTNATKGPDTHNWVDAAIGDSYGRYRLVEYLGTTRRGQLWRVRCECGREADLSLAYLRCRLSHGRVPQCADCGRDAVNRRKRAERAQRMGTRQAWAVADSPWSLDEVDQALDDLRD